MTGSRVRFATRVAATVLVLGKSTPSEAASLATQLRAIPERSAGASELAVDVFTPRLLELTARGIDFPAASTTPGTTYTYNPDLGVYERSTLLGPVYLERAETVGEGKFDLAASYLRGNMQDLNGNPLTTTQRFAYYDKMHVSFQAGHENFSRFSLVANVWAASLTYGITPDWDVNVLVPVVWTSLGVSAQATGLLPVSVTDEDNKVGVGDILLRTKYHFFHRPDQLKHGPLTGNTDLAAGFVLRVPTGKPTNFHGLGATIVTPLLIASRTAGDRAGFYVNLGFDADATNADASRFRYGMGAVVQPLDWLAGLLELLGSSGVSSTSVTQVVGTPGSTNSSAAIQSQLLATTGQLVDVTVEGPSGGKSRRAALGLNLARIDILDLSAGVKLNLPGNLVAYATAIFPLTSAGVTANVIPTVGISWSPDNSYKLPF